MRRSGVGHSSGRKACEKSCNGNASVVCEEEWEGPELLKLTTKVVGGSTREVGEEGSDHV